MKSGTAQKLVLNMISTGLMIRMGYILGNLMVNLQIKNAKLADRARRIVEATTGCGGEQAELAIEASGGQVRLAILMKKLQLDQAEAESRLNECGDNLRKALSLDDQ
jgi:N-acetylmuramic acid 6-phosphate etherase